MFFFFNDTATTEIYTLSLHDALPISGLQHLRPHADPAARPRGPRRRRSEEHTSELQSPCNLVCRLLLEKKKQLKTTVTACNPLFTLLVLSTTLTNHRRPCSLRTVASI